MTDLSPRAGFDHSRTSGSAAITSLIWPLSGLTTLSLVAFDNSAVTDMSPSGALPNLTSALGSGHLIALPLPPQANVRQRTTESRHW